MSSLPKAGDFLGHPKGLFLLFGTEMWERFGYYGMRAILVLYLVALVQEGGFGWSNADALSLTVPSLWLFTLHRYWVGG